MSKEQEIKELKELLKVFQNEKLINALNSNKNHYAKIFDVIDNLPHKQYNTDNNIINYGEIIDFCLFISDIDKEKGKPIYISYIEKLSYKLKEYSLLNKYDEDNFIKLINFCYENKELMFFLKNNYGSIDEEIKKYYESETMDIKKKEIGKIGELLFNEKKKLEFLKHISRLYGDGVGFDFYKLLTKDIELLMEVKTSLINEEKYERLSELSMHFSKNEIEVIKNRNEDKEIYLVHKVMASLEKKDCVIFSLFPFYNDNEIIFTDLDKTIIFEHDGNNIFKAKLNEKNKEKIKVLI